MIAILSKSSHEINCHVKIASRLIYRPPKALSVVSYSQIVHFLYPGPLKHLWTRFFCDCVPIKWPTVLLGKNLPLCAGGESFWKGGLKKEVVGVARPIAWTKLEHRTFPLPSWPIALLTTAVRAIGPAIGHTSFEAPQMLRWACLEAPAAGSLSLRLTWEVSGPGGRGPWASCCAGRRPPWHTAASSWWRAQLCSAPPSSCAALERPNRHSRERSFWAFAQTLPRIRPCI